MKQIYITLILVLTLSSCSYKKTSSKTIGLCENELKLLYFDTIAPVTNYKLVDFRDNVWTKFDSIFEDFYCRQVKLKVNFEIDKDNTIKLLLYSNNYCNCGDITDIPPFNPFVNWIHIYLDKRDSLLIRRETASLDSVKAEVIKRYHELPRKEYDKVNIALLWEKETNTAKFSRLINDCIEGYLYVANEVSYDLFNRQICDLTPNELEILNKEVPLKLRTDFWGGLSENYDFVPHELPPPPLESEMKILNIYE